MLLQEPITAAFDFITSNRKPDKGRSSIFLENITIFPCVISLKLEPVIT